MEPQTVDATDGARLVDRSEWDLFDQVEEGVYIIQWEDPGSFFTVASTRLQCIEIEPGRCVLDPTYSDVRTIRFADLPPQLVRGVAPPIDCRVEPCARERR